MIMTVLLSYPDYLTGGDLQTYLAHIEANDESECIRLAKREASKANDYEYPNDFALLFTTYGHVEDFSHKEISQ